MQLWGPLQRHCRVLGAATDSWRLQPRCSAAMTRCGRARLAAGPTEIVSIPRLVGIRALCRWSQTPARGRFSLSRNATRSLEICPARGRLLTLRRRVLPHVDHILDTVINVPLACFQGSGVRLADHCLGEAPLTLINHEVSPGPLLAPENLALQHPFSIPLYADAPFGLWGW